MVWMSNSRPVWSSLLCWLVLTIAAHGQGLPQIDPATVGLSAERLMEIETMAHGYVDSGAMPGVLTMVVRHGRVADVRIVGYRHLETGEPLEIDTIFRIYSMTKPVTGVAILQLVEAGRLRLSDPVAKYLPELAELEVWVSGPVGAPTFEAARPMTIEHLLSHTSGLTYDDESIDGLPTLYAAADLYTGPDLAAFVTKLARLPLASQPGTRWEYSVSMDVLGRVVEVVSGEQLDTYMQDQIFGPLGMVDTGFSVPKNKVPRFAALYSKTDDGGMKRIERPEENEYLASRPVPFGGSGLVSTASDYARFASMLANGGELDGARILPEKSVALMMQDHLGFEYGPHPLASSWLGESARGLGFGLTGAVVRDGEANGVPGSTGAFFWGGAASTFFWVDREKGLVGLQFTQLMPSDAYPIRREMRQLTYNAIVDTLSSEAEERSPRE